MGEGNRWRGVAYAALTRVGLGGMVQWSRAMMDSCRGRRYLAP
jgi:hypothetical protein